MIYHNMNDTEWDQKHNGSEVHMCVFVQILCIVVTFMLLLLVVNTRRLLTIKPICCIGSLGHYGTHVVCVATSLILKFM